MLKVMQPEKAAVSGVLWKEIKAYFIETHNEEKLEEIVSSTPSSALKKFFHRKILPFSVSKAEVLKEFYTAWCLTWPDPEGDSFRIMINWVAKQNIKKLMTILTTLHSPDVMARNFPKMWDHFFNFGALDILEEHERSVLFEVKHASVYGASICPGVMGWTTGALEAVGAQNVRVEKLECCFKGQSRCLYRIGWQ